MCAFDILRLIQSARRNPKLKVSIQPADNVCMFNLISISNSITVLPEMYTNISCTIVFTYIYLWPEVSKRY